jgi:hypothetical protein
MNDRDLLAACIVNDRGAWRELVARYDNGLRVKVYRRCAPFLSALPSAYQDDIMGAFYRRLVENDMRALRSFDWQKGTALFKWFALLVGQCASEYLTVELTHAARRASVSDAMGIADEGGVLSSGVRQVARKPRRKARRRFGRRFLNKN